MVEVSWLSMLVCCPKYPQIALKELMSNCRLEVKSSVPANPFPLLMICNRMFILNVLVVDPLFVKSKVYPLMSITALEVTGELPV